MAGNQVDLYKADIQRELDQWRYGYFENRLQVVLWEQTGTSEKRIETLQALLTFPETRKILRENNPERTRTTIALYNEMASASSSTPEKTAFYTRMAELLQGALKPRSGAVATAANASP